MREINNKRDTTNQERLLVKMNDKRLQRFAGRNRGKEGRGWEVLRGIRTLKKALGGGDLQREAAPGENLTSGKKAYRAREFSQTRELGTN